MSEGNKLALGTVFHWFKTNERAAWNTLLIGAVVSLFWLVINLYQDRIEDNQKFKDEMIMEVRRAYDPKFRDIKETIDSSTSKLDTAINNVNNYVNQNK